MDKDRTERGRALAKEIAGANMSAANMTPMAKGKTT